MAGLTADKEEMSFELLLRAPRGVLDIVVEVIVVEVIVVGSGAKHIVVGFEVCDLLFEAPVLPTNGV